jgi:hypothetical protein
MGLLARPLVPGAPRPSRSSPPMSACLPARALCHICRVPLLRKPHCAIDPLYRYVPIPQRAASRSKRRMTFDNGGGTCKSRRRHPAGVWRRLAPSSGVLSGGYRRRISPERTPNQETGSTRAMAWAAECRINAEYPVITPGRHPAGPAQVPVWPRASPPMRNRSPLPVRGNPPTRRLTIEATTSGRPAT